jgi:hypothetical protein
MVGFLDPAECLHVVNKIESGKYRRVIYSEYDKKEKQDFELSFHKYHNVVYSSAISSPQKMQNGMHAYAPRLAVVLDEQWFFYIGDQLVHDGGVVEDVETAGGITPVAS